MVRLSIKICLCVLGFIMFHMMSCTVPGYLPSRQMIPVLKEKNDFHLDASISEINPLTGILLRGNSGTFNLSTTYALSPSLGVHMVGHTTFDTIDNRKHVGLGLGYYKFINKKTHFQGFTNVTRGRINSWEIDVQGISRNLRADSYSVNFQPQFTFRMLNDLQLSFIPAMKYNMFRNIESYRPNQTFINQLRIEPSISLTYIVDNLKLNLEMGGSKSVQGTNGSGLFYSYLSVGFGYCFTCKNDSMLDHNQILFD